jgi:hypothetical protein
MIDEVFHNYANWGRTQRPGDSALRRDRPGEFLGTVYSN